MRFLTFYFLIIVYFNSYSQEVQQEFKLINEFTLEAIPYANIVSLTKNKSTKTNINGMFTLRSNQIKDSYEISYLGYRKKKIFFDTVLPLNIIYMTPLNKSIQEVTIKGSDNAYLYDMIEKSKKNIDKKTRTAKSYYQLKSFINGEQVELVESYLNTIIEGYDIISTKLKAGRIGLKKSNYTGRGFTSQESSQAIIELKLMKENSKKFPMSPLWMNKKQLKNSFYLDIDEIILDENKDSIYVLSFSPKVDDGNFFHSKIWLNSTRHQFEKVNLICPVATIHPFYSIFRSDRINNVGFEITTVFQNRKFHQVDFKYTIDYTSNIERPEKYPIKNYIVSSELVFYAYDYTSSFQIPRFQYSGLFMRDYSLINAYPYNDFFWKYNDENKLYDTRSQNDSFLSDTQVVTNKLMFNLLNKKIGLHEHPFIHWSENRIIFMESKVNPFPTFDKYELAKIEKEIRELDWYQRYSYLKKLYGATFNPFQLSINLFLDVNTYQDSTNYMSSVVLDPYASYCHLLLDRKMHCVINLIFDHYELSRRKLQEEITIKKSNMYEIDKLYLKTKEQAKYYHNILEKLTQFEYDKKSLLDRNELIKSTLKIDNIKFFEVPLESKVESE